MSRILKIAIAQTTITSSVQSNKENILRIIRDAAESGADIVLFPECALTGYLGFDRTTLDDLCPRTVHTAVAQIQEECAKWSVGSVVGQYFRRCGRWYNNAVAIGRSGELLASYDKLQLVDQDCYEVAPGEQLGLFTYDGIRCSMAICHDIRYPEVLREYGKHSVQVHFHLFYGHREPGEMSNHYRMQYDAHLITRAVENGFFLVAANASLGEQMVRSQCRDTEGRCIAYATSYTPELLRADIDVTYAGDGWAAKRRDDLFDTNPTNMRRQSYFERGMWEQKNYMTQHRREP